jgi:hypothetical protein
MALNAVSGALRSFWQPLEAALSSAFFYRTCLRGSGVYGNNGTHAYRSTLRAYGGGNI